MRWAIVLAVTVLVASGCDEPRRQQPATQPATQADAADKARLDAIYAARYAVRLALKNPDAARFPLPESGDYGMNDEGGGRYLVSGHVTSTNSFGATVRESWLCRVEPEGRDEWRATFIKVGGVTLLGNR